MSRKPRTSYRCDACGHQDARFFGICSACGEAGTACEYIAPSADAPRAARPLARGAGAAGFQELSGVSSDGHARTPSGIDELDRVLGGGLVPGSYIVLSAAPGQGKSTLASQLLESLSARGRRVGLVAAEESANQVKLRFERLGSSGAGVRITTDNIIERVIEAAIAGAYDFLVVDSIQTVFSQEISGSPGSVSQVRECGQSLMRLAKEHGVTVLLIGQVTKDGTLAGPRTLEHMVDVVLELEGDRDQQLRVLRAVKNRFGSTDEIGIFEMTGTGLVGVSDPSRALGTRRDTPTAGAVVCPVIEGSRPLLVEVQALVTPTNLPQPIRACRGIDPKRFQLLNAVLSRRGRVRLGSHDVFLQLAGGVRVEDPALDAAICVAIASAFADEPVPAGAYAFGEVSLLGELRAAPQAERRRQEAQRMGFTRLLGPPAYEDLSALLGEGAGIRGQVPADAGDGRAH